MRKTIDYTVANEGRDKGKVFHIREMPAAQAEKWAMRAILALAHSGVQLPDGFAGQGMRGIAELGVRALTGMQFEEAEPLLDEMMQCVEIRPDPSNQLLKRPLIDDDIEEIETRLLIRMEVAKLHVDFSTLAARSNSTETT